MKALLVVGVVVLYISLLGLAMRDDTSYWILLLLAYLSGACGMYLALLALGKVKEDQ